MAIIKKQKVEEFEKLTIKMEKELALKMKQYAAYVNASWHYVVSEAVRHVIEKDKEFWAQGKPPMQNAERRSKRAAAAE